MRKSRVSDSQIMAILNKADSGVPAAELSGKTVSVRRCSIAGEPSMAAWTSR